MKKLIVVLIIFSAFFIGCSKDNNAKKNEENSTVATISVEDVKKIVDNYIDYPNVDIVDVRSEDEFLEGHIPGAINIPLSYIEEINISTDREIIVYCQSGIRSKEAALKLKDLGYENVKDMGGISNYNYELEK